jgi:hypothetical protein
MKWKKWDFEVDKQYARADVVGACDARIREGGVIRDKSKNLMVRRIEKYAPAIIVWKPSREQGWGASPFNKNCWRTIGGGHILTDKTG